MQKVLLFIAIIFFASCSECNRYAKNYVIDKKTRKPIFGVQVLSVAATDGKQEFDTYTYTDSVGSFEAMFTKANVTKCPVLKLSLSKTGYYPLRVWDPVLADTLVMQKISN
jgi:hypothetical protein